MKFITGYIPGSKSRFNDGPVRYIVFTARHDGKDYEFERFERNESGLYSNKLRIYDSKDYPDEMIALLIESKHILPSLE